jgi:type IV pilus assembly protein PilX
MMALKSINKNTGSVLVISLLILLTLTILGVTALNTTVMEERMSSNTRQRNLAHQAAETALKAAEQWLGNTASNVTLASHIGLFNANSELYDDTVSGRSVGWNVNDTAEWTAGNSQAVTTLNSFPTDASIIPGAPRYIIEYIGRVGDPPLNFTDPDLRDHAFRIVVIGWGPDKTTKVVLSSTFSKRLS